jgi:3-dehydroquinate dehydratase
VPSTVFVLNGPNLDLLGTRQPEVYGHDTLADVKALVDKTAAELDLEADFRQSNHEGAMIDAVICGCGPQGCALALQHTAALIGASA